jgi:hypothetical protein
LACVAVVAACQSQSALELEDATAVGTGGADGGSCRDLYAKSSKPNDPCSVDSDCHDPFLVCAAETLYGCRGDGGVDETSCAPAAIASLPACPTQTPYKISVCSIRYRQGCNVDTDCGPGFGCETNTFECPQGATGCGQCQVVAENLCATAATCPVGWSCYVACPCSPARCYPPFSSFNCPICLPP